MDIDRKKIIANNITKYRKEKGITQKELAQAIGIQPSTLSDYINLRSAPSHGIIQNIANYFQVKKSDIDTTYKENNDSFHFIYNQLHDDRKMKVYDFAEKQLNEQKNIIDLKNYIEENSVRVYSALSAGTGIIDLDPSETEIINYKGYVPKHDLAFIVSGDSMTPMFEDGEIVFVDKTQDVHNGQVIAVQINDEAYIKKVYIEKDRLRLVSLNKEYDDIYSTEKDDIRIVGRVIL